MDLVIDIIKQFIIATVSFLFFNRIKPLKFSFLKKAIAGVGFIILTTATFVALKNCIGEPYKTAIVILVTSIFLAIILKQRIEVTVTSFIIVYASSYILYLISTIFSAIIMYPFGVPPESIFFFVTTGVVSIIIALLLMKIKLDFSPIHKKFVSGIFVSISGIVIILYGLFKIDISYETVALLIAAFISLGYGLYSWFRRETTISKNENANEVLNKKLEEIHNQRERDFAVLKDMHDYLASVVHKDDKKLDAMQRAVEKLIMRSNQTDVLDDAILILDAINTSRAKADKEYNKKLLDGISLPLTGLQIVDAKFETVFERALIKSIDFDLEIDGDISGFEQIIPQFDLVNVIGDLAENSFIAIKHLGKDQPCQKIQVTLGFTDNIYELSISDSGIPFNVDVLLKLGVERVTSHPDDGGSGYGYETIFGILNEHGASLIITEYESVSYAYSKNIVIRFDGKSDYIIKSFRADTIRKQNTNTNLAILDL